MAELGHDSPGEVSLGELVGHIELPPVVDIENAEIPLGVNYGMTCGPMFDTEIVTKRTGQEQRWLKRIQAQWQFQAGQRRLFRRELDELHAFHRQHKGMHIGFLARDWGDYKMPRQTVHIADGEKLIYPILKAYGDHWRRIRKPIYGTVKHWVNGIEGDASVTYDSGELVFPSEPPLNATIEIECEFLMPVRFATDQFQAEFLAWDRASGEGIWQLGSLPMIELPPDTDWRYIEPTSPRTTNLLDIGVDYNSIGGGRYNTEIISQAGGEVRDALWQRDLGNWQIGQRTYNQTELNHMLEMFLGHWGQARGWQYHDWNDDTFERQEIGEGDGNNVDFGITRYTDDQAIPVRNVELVVNDSAEVWVDGNKIASGWSVLESPARIRFDSTPAQGAVIECQCKIKKWARFGTDTFSYRFLAKEGDQALFSVGGLPVMELLP